MAESNGTVKHIEVDGIEMDVDLKRFEDPRFAYALGKMVDETVSATDRMKYASSMLDTLFGDDTYRIMCELADGGVLSLDRWNAFYSDVMDAVKAKN